VKEKGLWLPHSVSLNWVKTNIENKAKSSEIALITLVEMLVKMQTEMWKTI
jgi:hypothetical protein